MKLQMLEHTATNIQFGPHTVYDGELLTLCKEDARRLLPVGGAVRLQDVIIAMPGSSLRFGPVLDITGIRCGIDGSAFPGICGQAQNGEVRTIHTVKNVALTVVANLPGIQEGIIDMTATAHSPFSRMMHFVCILDVDQGSNREEADAVLRRFQCRLAEFIASHAVHLTPFESREMHWPLPACPELPKVGFVYLVQGQGALRRTYFRGTGLDLFPEPFTPREVSPLDILSGTLVSGNYVLCCNKSCTYIHQNNPVIIKMLAEHGRTLDFQGVIMTNEASATEGKESNSRMLAELARERGWQGGVVNQEGGGNADTDSMLACRELEKRGIATVLLLNEFAGPDGLTPSLAETTPEATWIVSTGNNDFFLHLPTVEKAEGFLHNLLGGLPTQATTLPLTRVHSSTNQLGFNFLSCETR